MLKKLRPLPALFIIQYMIAMPAQAELSLQEQTLYELLNDYRAEHGLPRIALSPALTFVAQTHVRDLSANPPDGKCNLHSWSASEQWGGCCYTSDHAQAQCLWDKPRELTDYPGNGYEISHAVTVGFKASAESALSGWQSSPGHNAVILNQGIWHELDWNAVGIGIYRNYAVVWFGKENDTTLK